MLFRCYLCYQYKAVFQEPDKQTTSVSTQEQAAVEAYPATDSNFFFFILFGYCSASFVSERISEITCSRLLAKESEFAHDL
jgi:hypothetical protein